MEAKDAAQHLRAQPQPSITIGPTGRQRPVRSPGPHCAPPHRGIPPSEQPRAPLPSDSLGPSPRQPQELKPLSRMPFSSGQVSPAEFTAGHAVPQPQLCFKVLVTGRLSSVSSKRLAASLPGRKSSTEAAARQLTACVLLRLGSEVPGRGLEMALSTWSPFLPIRQWWPCQKMAY